MAELVERRAIPSLLLAVDLLQLDRAEPISQRREAAARLDGGELALIADQHDLGPSLGCVVEQPGGWRDRPSRPRRRPGRRRSASASRRRARGRVGGRERVAVDPPRARNSSAARPASAPRSPDSPRAPKARGPRRSRSSCPCRPGADHLDAVVRGDELADHRCCSSERTRPPGRRANRPPSARAHACRSLANAAGGLVDHPRLERSISGVVNSGSPRRSSGAAGRSSRRLRSIQRDDLVRGDQSIRRLLDLFDRRASAVAGRQLAHHVPASERRPLGGQPFGANDL